MNVNRARYRPAISTGYPRIALLADTTGGAMITTALARLSVVFPRLKVAQLDRGHGVRREVFELEIDGAVATATAPIHLFIAAAETRIADHALSSCE